jgi:hypothetical protein
MRMRNMALATLAGAAVAYFLDPISGSARRRRLRERVAGFVPNRAVRRVEPAPLPENMAPAPAAVAVDEPVERPTAAGTPSEDQGDDAIARRVRQRLQGRPDLETGSLVIDVVRGVAYLRGDLHDRARFDEIVDLTGSVPGVRRVQSLLHLPESETTGEPANRPPTRPLGDAWNG